MLFLLLLLALLLLLLLLELLLALFLLLFLLLFLFLLFLLFLDFFWRLRLASLGRLGCCLASGALQVGNGHHGPQQGGNDQWDKLNCHRRVLAFGNGKCIND